MIDTSMFTSIHLTLYKCTFTEQGFANFDLPITSHQAIIGHQQLSDTVELYGFFCTRENRVNFAEGRGIVVNRKIRRNKLASDQEIDMLT